MMIKILLSSFLLMIGNANAQVSALAISNGAFDVEWWLIILLGGLFILALYAGISKE